jgi:hypothetical protein
MSFIELTEHNLTDSKYDRRILLNTDRIEGVVPNRKGDNYTVLVMVGEGDHTYYVKESYEAVSRILRGI